MGIIRWGLNSVNSAYADQPKEVLNPQGLSNDVLAAPASGTRKGKAVNGVITDGSVFNVGINQAALLIENGKVHDFVIATDEKTTGQYIYDTDREPSLLTGGLKEWDNVWKMVKNRFTFGGQSPNIMNLVYINLKEINENPVGVGQFPFIDNYLKTRLMLGAHGYYTFRISNPVTFYENVMIDPTACYDKDKITSQLKAEMMPKIQTALAKVAPLCTNGYQDIYLHDKDIAQALNEELGQEWLDKRGIELVKVALTPELSPADEKRVMQLENAKTLSNTDMALGSMVNAQNDAMQRAASNSAGAMTGFMGMGMAAGGGLNAGAMIQDKMAQEAAARTAAAAAAPAANADTWTCSNCGNVNQGGKFCSNCGTPKPTVQYCPECGTKAEAGQKFCTNCGHKF